MGLPITDMKDVVGKAGRATKELLGNFLPAYLAVTLWVFLFGVGLKLEEIGGVIASNLILASITGLLLSAIEAWTLNALVRPEKYFTSLLKPTFPSVLKEALLTSALKEAVRESDSPITPSEFSTWESVFRENYQQHVILEAMQEVRQLWLHRYRQQAPLAEHLSLTEGRILCFTYTGIVLIITSLVWWIAPMFTFPSHRDLVHTSVAAPLWILGCIFLLASRREITNYRLLLAEQIPILKTLRWTGKGSSDLDALREHIAILKELKRKKGISKATFDEELKRLKAALQREESMYARHIMLNQDIFRIIEQQIEADVQRKASQEIRQQIETRLRRGTPSKRRITKTSEPRIWDVIVCGAGVSGALAAQLLAATGFTTLLLEKHSLPRYKACGGVISQEFVDLMNLPEDIIERHIEQLVLHHVGHQVFEKQGEGACVWRADLDAFFARQAVAAGATFKEKTPVSAARLDDNLYQIETPTSHFKARMLIAADGVASTILRHFGWQRFRPDAIAQTVTHEIELGNNTIIRRFGEQHIHLYFGHRVSRMGYGWVFPKKDIVSVGWWCQLSHTKNAQAEFSEFLKILKEPLAGGRLVHRTAQMLPIAPRKQLGEGGLLAVGDAAGLVDPISGKGIPYAVTSGRLAAETAAYALETGTINQAATRYHSALEAVLLVGLRAKRVIQEDVYRTEENIHRFLQLWLDHRATTIASSIWDS